MAPPDVVRTVEAVWRMEAARIVGALTRMLRDVGLAEELAQDAMVEALERWPRDGMPDNPAAWLMQVAKHRALDGLRRKTMHASKEGALAWELETLLQDQQRDPQAAPDAGAIDDDVLRLIFVACHPLLPPEARAALTLKVVAGLKSPARFSCPRQRSRSASCAPSARCSKRACRSRCRMGPSSRRAWPPCCR
jgi:predicted RNA polymerase sigma factor